MHWTLSSAVLRCSRRRAKRAIAAGPLVAGLAATLLLGLPLLALVSGRQVAPLVAAASGDGALAKAFAASVVGPALVLGLAFGALAPDDRLLGPQLVAAPVGRIARFASLTLVPLVVVVAPLSAPVFVGTAAASVDARPGRWLATAMIGALIAAAALGAALAAATTAASRSPRLLALPAALGLLWLAVGAAGREPLLGVAAPLARAVAVDPSDAVVYGAVGIATAALAVAAWVCAAVLAPHARRVSGQARFPTSIRGGPGTAVGATTLLRLARHSQIRRHIAIACALALIGTSILRMLGVGEAGASFLPIAAALVAAAALPPAAVGLRRDAEWLLRACPAQPAATARAAATAAVIAAAAAIVLVVAVAAPVAALERSAWPLAETSAAVVLAAAVVGGALVPWRADRVAEQTVSYVVVGAIAATLSYAVSRGAGEAAALGVPEVLFVAVVANAALVAAVALSGALER